MRITKKMVEKNKKIKKEKSKISANCEDKFCPVHGKDKLKMRGRVFQGEVIRKLQGKITIQFERTVYIRKYERYEKRRTKLHARLPNCMKDEIDVGDLVQITETRPISKMIHFVVTKVIRKEEGKNESN